MTVVLGAHRIDKKEKSQQWIQVADYIQHPNYTDDNNDIMLLKVNIPAQKSKLKQTFKKIYIYFCVHLSWCHSFQCDISTEVVWGGDRHTDMSDVKTAPWN